MKTLKYLLLLVLWAASASGAPALVKSDVFVSGADGYHTYRIPALLVSKGGAVLAFCEGRKNGKGDAGDIDVLLKRSVDGGKTWSQQNVIWDDGANTCGNPCAVLDEDTGAIFLLLTHNLGSDKEGQITAASSLKTRTVWICKSADEGKTWSAPREITSAVKDPAWGWYATGPGVGIQLKYGPLKGRLVIPCDHSWGKGKEVENGSHVIFSDDHGQHWQFGGVIRPKMNECQVVEVADREGTLLINMRSYLGRHCRAQSQSRDGGASWSSAVDVPELIEPICQASMLRYSWPGNGNKSVILLSNPADRARRKNMTVRASYSEGKTWLAGKTIEAGFSAYSCLAVLPDHTIGCLYERGEKNAAERISLARFPLEWLAEK